MANEAIYVLFMGKQQGPFTADELREKGGLNADDMVWYAGLSDWKRADQAPLTVDLVKSPAPQEDPYEDYECPDTYMTKAVLATIFCCVPFGIVAIVFASKTGNLYREGDYEGAEWASERARHWINVAVFFGVLSAIASFFLNLAPYL